MELQVQPQEFGLSEEKGMQIMQSFSGKLTELQLVQQSFNQVIGLELNDETVKQAKEVLKVAKSIRTSTNKIHKTEKDFYLQGGRFVDALKNKIVVQVEEIEARLTEIVKHKEIAEKAIQDALLGERTAICEKYGIDTIGLDLGTMKNEVWDSFIKVKKQDWEESQKLAKLEAERDKTKLHILSLDLIQLTEYELLDEELTDTYNGRLDELIKTHNSNQWHKTNIDDVDFNRMQDVEIKAIQEHFYSKELQNEVRHIYSLSLEQLDAYKVVCEENNQLHIDKYKEKLQSHYNAQLLKSSFSQVDTNFLSEEQVSELKNHFEAKSDQQLQSNMQSTLNDLSNNFMKGVVINFDNYKNTNFGKYQEDYLKSVVDYEKQYNDRIDAHNKRQAEITTLVSKLYKANIKDNMIFDLNNSYCIKIAELTLGYVDSFNTHQKNIEAEQLKKLGDNEQLFKWIETFSINQAPINSAVSQEITNKFNSFVAWAKNQVTK